MNTLTVGARYRLPYDPQKQNTVDGLVKVLRVGPIGPDQWATVSVRVPVPDDELGDGEQPGLVEDTEWLTLVSRLGQPLHASGICPSCGGSGGRVEVEIDGGGVMRQTWHPCGTCHGSGVRG